MTHYKEGPEGWESLRLERYVDHVKKYLNDHGLKVHEKKHCYVPKIDDKKKLTKKEAESIILTLLDENKDNNHKF